jgi:hypothetical protein
MILRKPGTLRRPEGCDAGDGDQEGEGGEEESTTWFLDRTGRLHFVHNDADGHLVEEAGWLIEDLKRR